MTGGQPKKMTILYVANTGHALAALTRTDSSGAAPTIANLAGDGLLVRAIFPKNSGTPWTSAPDMFFVPTGDLKSVDIGIDSSTAAALFYPRDYGISIPSSSSTPASQPILEGLNKFVALSAAPTIGIVNGSLTLPFASVGTLAGLQYYALIVSQVTQPNETPVVLKSSPGTIPTGGGSVSISLGGVILSSLTYSVLILVQNMLPTVYAVVPT